MRNKLMAALTIVALLTGTVPAYAEQSAKPPVTEEAEQPKVEAPQPSNLPQIECNSYIVMDGASGKVLFGKDEASKQFPASTTKIMTAIIAIEKGKLDDVVTVGKEPPNADGTKLYLHEGEQVPLEKLLYTTIVYSANDAAAAIAEHIAGSQEAFAEMMNAKAKEIGMKNTNFVNPHGLSDDLHVTTAEDLAILGRYAMDNQTYRKIAGTETYNWQGNLWQSIVGNKNQLLKIMPEATGVKNGYTSKAKYTLVGSAEKNGQELIGVILGSPSEQIYKDMAKILNYGFSNYVGHSIAFANDTITTLKFDEKRVVDVVVQEDVGTVLTKESAAIVDKQVVIDQISLPIEKGQVVGKVIAIVDGKEVDQSPLIASASVGKPTNWLLVITSVVAGIYLLQILTRFIRMQRKKRKGLAFKQVSKNKTRG